MRRMTATRFSISCVSMCVAVCLCAAPQKGDDPKKASSKDQQRETVAKPLTDKQRKKNEEKKNQGPGGITIDSSGNLK